MSLSERVGKIGLSPTLGVSALAARLRASGEDIVDFSAGQPDFPTPEPAKHAGRQAIDENRTRYTANEGLTELREAIVAKLARDNALSYEPSEILVSPGAKASLYFAIMALVDPGDEVLIPSPYWVTYPEQVRLAGGRPVFVETVEEQGFKLDPGRLEAALTRRSRVLILNHPGNPTGAGYTPRQLAALAEVCIRRELAVVADEIYEKLLYDGLPFTSFAAVDERMRERCVVVNGMSKAYAMTGWRIGYAAAPRPIVAAMGRLQSHCTSNATSISQWASVAALEQGTAEVERRRGEFQRRRDVMVEALRALPGVRCTRPEGAFYLFPDVSGCFRRGGGDVAIGSGEELARYLLETARVAVVPGEAFGSSRHVRLSYAESLSRIEEGMRRIGDAIRALHGS